MIGLSYLTLKSVSGRRERAGRRIVFLAPLHALGQVEAWRLRLAYSSAATAVPTASRFQDRLPVFENAVATDGVIDYGGLALKGVLGLLEALPGDR